MPVNINADPNQVNIPQDQGLGLAQDIKQPDLSYLDKLADINARNRQALAVRQQKQQQGLLKSLDISSQGKTWAVDSPYLIKQQQGLRDFLEQDNNATKIAKGDLDAQLKFNTLADNLRFAVGRSVQKNSDMSELNKELQTAPGGIDDYYSGAKEELAKHYQATTDAELNDPTYEPPTVNHQAFQKRLAPGTTFEHVKKFAGVPETTETQVINPDKTTTKKLTTAYTPEQIKEGVIGALSNPAILKEESENLNDKWDDLSPQEKEKYTVYDENGQPKPGRAGHNVSLWVEDRYKPLARTIKSSTINKNAPTGPGVPQTSIDRDSQVERTYPVKNAAGQTEDNVTAKGVYGIPTTNLGGLTISPADSYGPDGQKIKDPVAISGKTNEIQNFPVYAGTTDRMGKKAFDRLMSSGQRGQIEYQPFVTIKGYKESDLTDAAGYNKAMTKFEQDNQVWQDADPDERSPQPIEPDINKYLKPGKSELTVTKSLVGMEGAFDPKKVNTDKYFQKAKQETDAVRKGGVSSKPQTTKTAPIKVTQLQVNEAAAKAGVPVNVYLKSAKKAGHDIVITQ